MRSGPSFGGVSFARATLIAFARSGPNHGLARPPFTGLRVVATEKGRRTGNGEASLRAPVAARLAQPPTASAAPDADRARSKARRDTAPPGCTGTRLVTPETLETAGRRRAPLPAPYLPRHRGNSRAEQ